LVLKLNGKKAWFFHGDVFDVTMQHAKWLAKMGAVGYDSLIILNRIVNWVLERLGREKMSFSKKIKAKFKDAVKFINQFEQTASNLAIDKQYDYVVCGHIHQPEMRMMTNEDGQVMYLNSGDWIENLTSLEYHKKKWKIFKYDPKDFELEDLETGALADHEDLHSKLDVNILLEQIKLAID
jgi:UDP-2,3-diacylglucosamine pyrophosphatase LpxH